MFGAYIRLISYRNYLSFDYLIRQYIDFINYNRYYYEFNNFAGSSLKQQDLKEQLQSEQTTDSEGSNSKETESSLQNEQQSPQPDPTRFGDWEKNGRCIDF